ncbi:MAG TPA: hypothetical protein DD458_07465 [Prolixibacteraceae bacterium]|nr:hypothetical protein [Prolixibacteraceae bacterium]HCU60273.1 hypothetical protein [Prolixibacteraceae bacterium]
MRNYRIFLPPGYDEKNPKKRFPVIYFLHGWDQRYFGSGQWEYASYDMGEENHGDNIANFVATHDVIVVKSDGYNKSPGEEYDRRPYNVGNINQVDTHRQFPVYYPELISFIDENYHTIANRNHRAISGLSMGGFMAFLIGGKYPHLFSTIGSFCGAVEFYAGSRSMPVEYRHIDMFKNFTDTKVRLNYGDKDFIRAYQEDFSRIWTQVLDDYKKFIYDAEHSTCGLGEMFDFFMDAFHDVPNSKPSSKWNHIDVYPEFTVWYYHVNSDRDTPGFTILENVDTRGWRSSVREFLPDGQLLPFVNVTLTTPPIYEENSVYFINKINLVTSEITQSETKSDDEGRLRIVTDGGLNEIGINEAGAKSNLVIASFETINAGWIIPGNDTRLSVKLLNKGLSGAKNVSAIITPTRDGTKMKTSEIRFPDIPVNNIRNSILPFEFSVISDSVEIVQFEIIIKEGNKSISSQKIEVPVRKEAPEVKDFMIADGRYVTVASAGVDTVTMILGKGNGDGIANPGESFVILVKDNGLWRRTKLFFSDNYLNPSGINQREEDSWFAYDKVGASFKYSIPLISSGCPQGHKVEMQCEYWLPDYPLHTIKRGKLTIEVSGNDSTPPIVRWVKVDGDNTIVANLWDGSKINDVKARFFLTRDSTKYVVVSLNDKGMEGDGAAGDNVFSKQIPQSRFNKYGLIIEATDALENKQKFESQETFILH